MPGFEMYLAAFCLWMCVFSFKVIWLFWMQPWNTIPNDVCFVVLQEHMVYFKVWTEYSCCTTHIWALCCITPLFLSTFLEEYCYTIQGFTPRDSMELNTWRSKLMVFYCSSKTIFRLINWNSFFIFGESGKVNFAFPLLFDAVPRCLCLSEIFQKLLSVCQEYHWHRITTFHSSLAFRAQG